MPNPSSSPQCSFPCYPQTSLVSKHRINLLERKGHFGYGHCPWYIMIQHHPPSRFSCSILRTLHVSPICDFLWQTKTSFSQIHAITHLLTTQPMARPIASSSLDLFRPRPLPVAKLLKPNSSKDISFLCHMIWPWLPRLFWRVRVFVSKICEDGLPNSSHPWPTFTTEWDQNFENLKVMVW